MKHKKLTQFDRDRIKALLNVEFKKTEIATVLKVPRSTISREIGRLGMNIQTYDPVKAQRDADNKRRRSKYQGMKIESLPQVKKQIIEGLENKRSPDEIAGRLNLEAGRVVIGKDSIYKWLYSSWGQYYCKYLCMKRYRRRKHKTNTKHEMIPNRVPLSERPEQGIHWQGDLFVSPQKLDTTESVATFVEEESKYLIASKLTNRRPSSMKTVVRNIVNSIHMDTLTLNNGVENKYHERFGVQSYFCEPYSPWEKPLVEQSIGVLRRWFVPKGTDLRKVSEVKLQSYVYILNHKYRKSLGYKSAYEVALERGIIKKIPSPLQALTRPLSVAIEHRI